MKRIAIVYAESKPHVPALLAELRGWLDERGWEGTFYGSRVHDPSAIAGWRIEAVSWKTFVETLFNPLQAELVARGFIDAIGMDLTDPAGRKKYVMGGHSISYLVVCRGVPLKVVNEPLIPVENVPPALANPVFKTNAASVDGELALLALSNTPLTAFVPNPLFKNDRPSSIDRGQIVKVGRLDGPSFPDARKLVDNALEAERTGLVVRTAKASLELHPPVEADKGTVVEAAAAGMAAVCFLGDDVGDLPAYDGLDRLAEAGVHTVRVAVSTVEAPAALLERADVVVDGPAGALNLLASLL